MLTDRQKKLIFSKLKISKLKKVLSKKFHPKPTHQPNNHPSPTNNNQQSKQVTRLHKLSSVMQHNQKKKWKELSFHFNSSRCRFISKETQTKVTCFILLTGQERLSKRSADWHQKEQQPDDRQPPRN